jgi:starch phosphorylase
VSVLGEHETERLRYFGLLQDGELNMTLLALRTSRYANAVSLRHGEVSRAMFPDFPISAITNGVHAPTWVVPAMASLFDRHMPEWRADSAQLRHAMGIPLDDLAAAHHIAKGELCAYIGQQTGVDFSPDVFTIGFARRAASYKRASLLFADTERLRATVAATGKLQIVYGGKAHPHDENGKAEIRRVYEAKAALGDCIDIVYLPNYEMDVAKRLVGGVDLWLNTPIPPLEASGTSGMKAALNGVPSLSTLDGWWVEGCVEDRTGWSFGAEDIDALYAAIALAANRYATSQDAYAEIARYAIAVNGSFFNSQRMAQQYAREAYATAGTHADGRTLREVAS